MGRKNIIHEGKAKILYEGPDPETCIQYFKDDATAFNAKKHDVISGKGVLNNRISSHIMTRLEAIGVATHFLKSLNMREQLVRKVEIIPLEIVLRNVAAGSLCKRLGIEQGYILAKPIVEFYLKDDALGDPMISEDHIYTFGWADPYELEEVIQNALRVNDFLNGMFSAIGIRLIDFKLEFGRLYGEDGELYIILADEISPDNCRLWDEKTGEKLDKDRFREDLGGLVEAYEEIAQRLGLIPKGGILKGGDVNEQIASGLDQIENQLASQSRLKSVKRGKSPRKI